MAEQNRIKMLPRMLVMVTREEDSKKIEKSLDDMHIPICFQTRGKGTAPSELLDIFGLRGSHQLVTALLLPKFRVKPVLEALAQQIAFRKKGGGIAITVPVVGLQGHMMRMLDEESRMAVQEKLKGVVERMKAEEKEMKEKSEYILIWVSVDSGYSDEVVDTAREAGAKGGTVMKGRRRSSEQASRHFGIAMQEEQDFVMIIVPREKKVEVMSAISRTCGLGTEAHGVVLSLPVDEVMGLEK